MLKPRKSSVTKFATLSLSLILIVPVFSGTLQAASKADSKTSDDLASFSSQPFAVYYGVNLDFFVFKTDDKVKTTSDNADKTKEKKDPFDGSGTRTSRKGANGQDYT